MSDNLFDVAVPDAELEAPAFTPVPTGAYITRLFDEPSNDRTKIAAVENGKGWKAIRLPFHGFRDTKTGKEYGRTVTAQFTYENANNAKSAQIGYQAIIGAAAALGLTEPSVTADGKPAQKLTASSIDELLEQFRAMVGTEVEVYMTVGPRKKAGQIVQRTDGSGPVMDNEIKRVSAIKV